MELTTIPCYAVSRFEQQSVYCVTTVSDGVHRMPETVQTPFRKEMSSILLMVLAARVFTERLTKILTERDHSFNTNIGRKFLSSFVSHRRWNGHLAVRSAQTDCRMPADRRSKIMSTLSQRFSVTHEWLVIVPGDGSNIQATCPHVFDSGCLVYQSSTSTAADTSWLTK